MWRPSLKRRWAHSSLRDRLNDYLRKKEKEEGYQDYYRSYRGQESFVVSLVKSLYSNLLIKITAVILIVLFASLISSWRHPLALKITDNIYYITTWDMNIRNVGQEVVPVMRGLWNGNLEEGSIDHLVGDEDQDWQQSIERSSILLPVKGEVAADYGVRLHPLWGREEMHYGVDLVAAPGSEVLAGLKGRVARIENHPYYYQLLYIDHGNEWVSVYGHIDDLQVSVNEVVEKGQLIGKVRDAPPAGEARLHFEVRQQGYPVDPMPFFQERR